MNGLATLRHINSEADMAGVLSRKPLKVLRSADDVRKAPDYSAVDIELLEHVSGYKEVDTYFVDSSGFGGDGIALDYPQFEAKVAELIEQKKSEGKRLYACLSGVGQFQVYVTVLEC